MLSTTSIYQTCQVEGISDSELLKCVSDSLEMRNVQLENALDVFFLLYAAALVFFMQAGFAMLCAGSVRQKNVQNTMLKNMLDACTGALSFWAIGYAFAYGDDASGYDGEATFIGKANFFLSDLDLDDIAYWLFQFAFAATSATIVAGTLAERCQMLGYMAYSMFLTGFIYPVVVHAVWSQKGFLSPYIDDVFLGTGVVDFAGSGVVHVTGGTAALFASYILGPRRGRFFDERTGERLANPKKVLGHSPSLQVMGTFILWFCWYGFNPGSIGSIHMGSSIAALAASTTTLAAAAAGITSLCVETMINERRTGEATFELTSALNGCLSGLVAITAGCGVVELWASVVIGIVAGLFYLLSDYLLNKYAIDDAVNAIPVHFSSGIVGMIGTGLFAKSEYLVDTFGDNAPQFGDHQGWIYDFSDARLLGAQVVCLLFIFGWVTFVMGPFFLFLDYHGYFRADPLEEVIGLDISYHGGGAYAMDEEAPKLEVVNVPGIDTDAAKERRKERLRSILSRLNDNPGETMTDFENNETREEEETDSL